MVCGTHMALSNWDTLAINQEGAFSDGDFIDSENEFVISIYKNWLYLRDVVGWTPKSDFIESTIAQIQSGEMQYKRASIHAVRGPQNGIYVLVESGHGETLRAMVGCGVSGYVYPPTECGHDANLEGAMSCNGVTYCVVCNARIRDAEWKGVSEECVGFLRNMLTEAVPGYLEGEERESHVYQKMANGLGSAKRFNQGDAFFAGALGQPLATVASTPAQTMEPIITELIDAMKNE